MYAGDSGMAIQYTGRVTPRAHSNDLLAENCIVRTLCCERFEKAPLVSRVSSILRIVGVTFATPSEPTAYHRPFLFECLQDLSYGRNLLGMASVGRPYIPYFSSILLALLV